jgi:hypothetical protein
MNALTAFTPEGITVWSERRRVRMNCPLTAVDAPKGWKR